MTSKSRLRFIPSTGEIEIEGSEAFVKEMLDRLEPEKGAGSSTGTQPENGSNLPRKRRVKRTSKPNTTATLNADLSSLDGFGEYLHEFPSKISNQDLALIAGRFIAQHTEGQVFQTKTVNKILQDQGIKLSNASLAVRRSLKAKYIFAKTKGQFRVSKTGIERLEEVRKSGVG